MVRLTRLRPPVRACVESACLLMLVRRVLSDPAVWSAVLGPGNTTGVLECDRICDLHAVSIYYDPALQSLAGFECLGALETLTVGGTAERGAFLLGPRVVGCAQPPRQLQLLALQKHDTSEY